LRRSAEPSFSVQNWASVPPSAFPLKQFVHCPRIWTRSRGLYLSGQQLPKIITVFRAVALPQPFSFPLPSKTGFPHVVDKGKPLVIEHLIPSMNAGRLFTLLPPPRVDPRILKVRLVFIPPTRHPSVIFPETICFSVVPTFISQPSPSFFPPLSAFLVFASLRSERALSYFLFSAHSPTYPTWQCGPFSCPSPLPLPLPLERLGLPAIPSAFRFMHSLSITLRPNVDDTRLVLGVLLFPFPFEESQKLCLS